MHKCLEHPPEPPLEPEDHLEAGEAAGGVVGRAVRREVLDQLQLRQEDDHHHHHHHDNHLRQLDAVIHDQRSLLLGQPLEHQVLRRVGHWGNEQLRNCMIGSKDQSHHTQHMQTVCLRVPGEPSYLFLQRGKIKRD